MFRNVTMACVLIAGLAYAGIQDKEKLSPAATVGNSDEAIVQKQLPLYPLDSCPISGEKLGAMGDAVDMVVDGRLVRLCCKSCIKKVAAEKDAIIAKLDAAAIAAQKDSWPLTSCPISGEPYGGEIGEPIDAVWGGRYVKLCCKGCLKAHQRDAAETEAKVEAALIGQLTKTYPLKTCPVSGETLGAMGEPIDMLYGTRLVRFCCKGCVKPFKADPEKFFAKLSPVKSAGGVKDSKGGQ